MGTGADAWQTMLAGNEISEVDAYGISCFVYRARRPFHPQRFWDFWMDGEHAPNILRSKGYFWLATKHAMSGYLVSSRSGTGSRTWRNLVGRNSTIRTGLRMIRSYWRN